ncbi:MAG: hypothetical protein FWD65_02485 [Coriobacteriia bacterium]|nr:hypothetical protein [Coriobacteriia bacterium]
MALSEARLAARETLTRVRERSAYAHESLDRVLSRHPSLSDCDSALATRLAYGAIACYGTLEEVVDRRLRNPRKTDPLLRDSLLLSTYELLFTDTPLYATVSEGVLLAKALRTRYASPTNAILRRIGRERELFPWGDPKADVEAHARLRGHPVWLAQLLRERFGYEQADLIMQTNNEAAPTYLAVMEPVLSASEALSTLTRIGAGPQALELPGALLAAEPAKIRGLSGLHARRLLVMDYCAQLAVHLADLRPGQRFIEVGAGRGSKTLLAATRARMRGGSARLVAIDLHAFKTEIITQDAAYLGYDEITALPADATAPLAPVLQGTGLSTRADVVLLDAPCSGLGTLRRHPDRRWRTGPADIAALAQQNIELLNQSAPLVDRRGTLIYSTCTMTAEENFDVLEKFLHAEAGRGFSIAALAPEEVPRSLRSFIDQRGCFQSFPQPEGPDGHFIARLRRR